MLRSTRTVTLATGVTVPCVDQGSRAAPPIVLLHGYTDSWRSFEPVLASSRSSERLIAFTQRGHGDAGIPERFRIEDFAAELLAFLDALRLERAIVVGHSMGSVVAQRFAIDHPDRLLGLVLVGAFAALRRSSACNEAWEEALARLADPIDPAFAREFQESTIAQPVPPAFLDMVVAESAKVPARVWRAAWRAMAEADLEPELRRIATPTLILWGGRDTLFARDEQTRLRRGIRGSRLLTYPAAGHALHWEEPSSFARDLRAFARECAGAARVPTAHVRPCTA